MIKSVNIDCEKLYEFIFLEITMSINQKQPDRLIDFIYFCFEMELINEIEFEYLKNYIHRRINNFDESFNILFDQSIYIEYSNYTERFDSLYKKMNYFYEKELNEMPYNIFLNSVYWDIVRNYKKEITGNKCQLCSSKRNLHTHHNQYKNRGKEYKNLNDLIVLCSSCHKNYHNK